MSKFLDRFRYFKQKGDTFADGHGQILDTNRDWEDGYRQRWQHDKIVRSTHGVNCTGSCSWKIYVKNGLVTWETQQTDYPRTRPDMPNHEPRGCPRGASYSWYLYSANRLKYPMMRKRLMKLWREAKAQHSDPVEAWASIMSDSDKAKSYKQARGRGGFVRSSWQEVNELIAASNVWTAKIYGPDRIAGFSPIPAMSMVSYASGARYLSLIGGTCLSFYDWYCDLPPASPMTWGEQTDVPESADWYNSSYIIAWGSNVPQTRTPDAHFFTEVRYKGTKTVAVTPDYAEIAKLCDQWLAPKQGTDSAMALAMGHVMLREFHLERPSQYFTDYVRRYTDMPMLVMLEQRDGFYAAGRMLRASDLVGGLGQENNPEWKTVAIDNHNGEMKAAADAAGMSPVDYTVQALKSGEIHFAAEQPENGKNHPRNLFVWRSNLLGSSGKGHEYMLKYLLGTDHGIQGADLGQQGGVKPEEVEWHDNGLDGKLDLVVTLDFRLSSTCLYSDIVLPTATWYEKDDMNTSDMHPFIHPLSAAVDPAWESKSDWEIYKAIAKKFSELCVGHLGKETDVVTLPIQHDSAAELAQPLDVKDWKKGECDLIPGKTAPHIIVVERDYPATYERFTSIGPLMEKIGNGGKGISWNTQSEMDLLRKLNYTKADGPAKGQPMLNTAIDAAEMILTLAPETNGHVAVKAWAALSEFTGRDHTHLATNKEEEKIRFRDIQAQPRKIISSPTWSGLEDEHVSYNAGYTNVHELIPWRTLSGRQQLYQDHPWMRDFGESLLVYRPPIDTRSVKAVMGQKSNGNPEKALNFLTPHQKWGIHSTYSDNLLMLTLSRGGPIVWMSEIDAKDLGIADNDWIEVFNANGALTARAVVSQRVPEGMTMMYHAQERIVNLPGSEVTGQRGGIHNSVTRISPKPTHMIGGYAQLAYGFNYYGTVGSNRDEFVVVRKMKNIDWLDGEGCDQVQESVK
ncbi:nitrate reductase subunit alpha [Atlantibacter sp.]|uniref:nitrate reductase subunit alpha n=1 Tax=Atlantibacter sp. TaxID=1903473 RepID=UPI0028AF870D|nr:nitrate reductase subunit alpha [Atlantibacter sp.]